MIGPGIVTYAHLVRLVDGDSGVAQQSHDLSVAEVGRQGEHRPPVLAARRTQLGDVARTAYYRPQAVHLPAVHQPQHLGDAALLARLLHGCR